MSGRAKHALDIMVWSTSLVDAETDPLECKHDDPSQYHREHLGSCMVLV